MSISRYEAQVSPLAVRLCAKGVKWLQVGKKRRRRTAIDPCLSYYIPVESPTSISLQPGTTACQRNDSGASGGGLQTSSCPKSTQKSNVDDNPSSHPENKLRSKHVIVTYSHKRKRLPVDDYQPSSENSGTQVSSEIESSSQVTSSVRLETSKGIHSCKLGMSKKRRRMTRKSRNQNATPLSVRVRRAALLTGVEMDEENSTASRNSMSLKLTSFDDDTLPASCSRTRRGKLVDPRHIKLLESSFTRAPDVGCKTKPLSSWRTSPFAFPKCLPKIPMIQSAYSHDRRLEADNSEKDGIRSIAALHLVSFEEHEKIRLSKFKRYVRFTL